MHANLGNYAKSVMARHARADCLFSLGGGIGMTGISGSISPDDPFVTNASPMTRNACRFLLTLQSLSYGPQTATSISTKSPDHRLEQTMNTRSSPMWTSTPMPKDSISSNLSASTFNISIPPLQPLIYAQFSKDLRNSSFDALKRSTSFMNLEIIVTPVV